jgi:hypothetical protein
VDGRDGGAPIQDYEHRRDGAIDGAIDAGLRITLVTPFEQVRRVGFLNDLTVTWQEIEHVVSRNGQLIGG